jgi:hypothetical protein
MAGPPCSTNADAAEKLRGQPENREDVMDIDRRGLILPALALALLGTVPAFAGADEDAQAAGNAEALVSLLAE